MALLYGLLGHTGPIGPIGLFYGLLGHTGPIGLFYGLLGHTGPIGPTVLGPWPYRTGPMALPYRAHGPTVQGPWPYCKGTSPFREGLGTLSLLEER